MKKSAKIILSVVLSLLMVIAPLSGATSVLADLVVKAHAVDYSALTAAINNYMNNAGYNQVSVSGNQNSGYTITDNSDRGYAYQVGVAMQSVVDQLVSVGNGAANWWDDGDSSYSISGQSGNFLGDVWSTVVNSTGSGSDGNRQNIISWFIPRPDGYQFNPGNPHNCGLNTGDAQQWEQNNVDAPGASYGNYGDITCRVYRSLNAAFYDYASWSSLPGSIGTSLYIQYHTNHLYTDHEWDHSYNNGDWTSVFTMHARKAASFEYFYFTASPSHTVDQYSGSTEISVIKNFGNYFTDSRLSQDPYRSDLFNLNWVNNEVNNNNSYYYGLVNNCSSTYYTHYFSQSFVNNNVRGDYMNNVEGAQLVLNYRSTVDAINNCVNAGTAVDESTYQDQKNNYNNSGSWYNTLTSVFNGSTTPRVLAYQKLQSSFGLKAWSDYTNYRTELKKNLDLFDLRDYKAKIMAVESIIDANRMTVTDTQAHKITGDASAVISSAQLGAYRDQLNGWYSAWNTYDVNLRNTVAAEAPAFTPTAVPYTYVADITFELNVRAYEPVYTGYVSWFEPRIATDVSGYSDAQIENLITEAEAQQTNYNNSYNACVAATSAQAAVTIFGTYSNNIQAYIDSLYNLLSARMTGAIDTAWSWYAGYNGNVNFNNFTMLKDYIDDVSARSSTYNFLQNTSKSGKNYFHSSVVNNTTYVSEYGQLLNGILAAYNSVKSTGGFTNYTQIYFDSNTGTYYTREAVSSDLARQPDETADQYNNNNDDYTVTESKINNTVTKLDDFLTGTDFAELADLSDKGADLPAVITNLLSEQLFSDKTFNQLVNIMPNICSSIEGQIRNIVNEKNAEDGGKGMYFSVGTPSNWHFGADGNIKLYCDTEKDTQSFPELFKSAGLYFYPYTFAQMCGNFPSVQNALNAAGRDWSKVDIASLNWGINGSENTFKTALTCVFNAILPVVQVMLCGWTGYDHTLDNAIYGYSDNVDAYALAKIDVADLAAWVDVRLRLNPDSGYYGYQNILGPIFEAFGVTDYTYDSISLPNPSGQVDAATMVNDVVGPIDALINQLKYHPLDKILSMLPNIAHAVTFDCIQPLVNNIPLTVSYNISGELDSSASWVSKLGDFADSLYHFLDNVYSGSTSLNLGEYVKLQDLLGISDITDLNSILAYIMLKTGVTDPDGDGVSNFNLPYINAGQLSFLGVKQVKGSIRNASINGLAAGQRYNISADRADVFWFLMKYISGTAGDTTFLKSLVGALGGELDVSGTLSEMIQGLQNNPDGAVAAIIELFNPQKYGFDKYNWQTTDNKASNGVTAASGVYLNYNTANDWTRNKAEYVYQNINDIIDAAMSGQDSESIADNLAATIQSLYKKDVIADLASTLGSLRSNMSLDDTMLGIIKKQLGIDLTYWDAYTDENITAWKEIYAYNEEDPTTDTNWQNLPAGNILRFADCDQDAFKNSLVSLLKPASGLIAFLLGNKDLSMFNGRSIYTGSNKVLTVEGYEGYTYGVVPLLKALGVNDAEIDTQAQFEARGEDNYIEYLVNIIFNRLHTISIDPIHSIISMLPNLLYFIYSDGMSTSINNILHSAYCLVDTARPIINIDIMKLIREGLSKIKLKNLDGDEVSLEFPATMDLKSFLGVNNLFDTAQKMTGLTLNPLLESCVRGLFIGNIKSYTKGAFTGYTLEYNDNFQPYDMLTVILELAIELINYGDHNSAILAKLLKVKPALFDEIYKLIGLDDVENVKINYCYFDSNLSPLQINTAIDTQNNDTTKRTIYKIENLYLTDWTQESSDYLADNFSDMVNSLLATLTKDDAEPVTSLSQILTKLPNELYTNSTLTKLATTLSHTLDGYTEEDGTKHSGVNAKLLDALNVVLDMGDLTELAEINGVNTKVSIYYKYTQNLDANGVYDFHVTAGDSQAFVDSLATLLAPFNSVLQWMLFDKDANFLYGSKEGGIAVEDGGDLIKVHGAAGYDTGLVPLLEAFGVTGLKNSTDLYNASCTDNTAIITSIAKPLLAKVDQILNDPDVLLDMLPNLIYFLNCDGFSISIKNTLSALMNVMDSVNQYLKENPDDFPITAIDLESLIGFDPEKLSLTNVLDLAENLINKDNGTHLNLSGPLYNIISGFFIGKLEGYQSVNGEPALRMIYRPDHYEDDRGDMMTIICCMLLVTLKFSTADASNSDAIAAIIGKGDADKTAKTKAIIDQVIKIMDDEGDLTMTDVNWLYMLSDLSGTFSAGQTVATTAESTMKYLQYNNNWTSEGAEYLVRNLNAIVDGVLAKAGSDPATCTALLSKSVNGFCNDKTVYNIVNAVATAIPADLKSIDTLVGANGLLYKTLDVNISAYDALAAKYKAAIDNNTPIVTDLDSFGNALIEVLSPLNGLLRWMLLSDDITLFNDDNYPTTDAYITISGASGYDDGIIPLYEALGCINIVPAAELYDTANTTDTALATALVDPLIARLKDLTNDTMMDGRVYYAVDKLLDEVPELLYFLNAGGVKAGANNILRALTNLLDEVNPLLASDKQISLDKLLKTVVPDVDLTNLDTGTLLDLLAAKTGIKVSTDLRNYITHYYLGTIVAYDSANNKVCYKTVAGNDIQQRMDLITSVVGIVIEVFRYEENAEPLNKLLPNGLYTAIMNVLDVKTVPIEPIDWINTDKADTGEAISPLTDTQKWPNGGYGKYWTKEKAEYVAANFGTGVDNVITLLGVEDTTAEKINQAANNANNKQVYFNSLEQVLNSLVGGKVYTESNAEKILSAIKNAVGKINDLPDSEYIKGEVLRCLNVDLDSWNDMSTFGITDGDRTAFVNALVTIIRPLEPVLAWMLRGDKDYNFFYHADGTDAVTLKSSEGYAYGIVPILEALGCKSDNILTPAAYNTAADANADNLVLNILNPLLDRVDAIFAAPADEIMAMLPEVIYFINSDGLDACFRNLLRSVYNVLNDIAPYKQVNLYDTLGFHLDTDPVTGKKVDFNYIIDWALALAKEKTGYEFDGMNLGSTLAQISVGTVESFTSKNGDKAYRMIYDPNDKTDTSDEAAMVTLVATALVKFVVTGDNANKLKALVNSKVSSSTAPYIDSLIDTLVKYANQDPGSLEDNNLDLMLGTFYYLFYGANTASKASNQFLSDFNTDWSFVYKCMSTSDSAEIKEAADQLYSLLDQLSGGVFDMNGLASKGLIPFFQKLVEMFQKIIAFFQSIFKVK